MPAPTRKPAKIVQLEELRDRLREAEETLAAIRNGEVDSLLVSGPHGDQVFSLKGAEQPYRIFVERMQEGAVTLTPDGTILYANQRFAQMIKCPLQKVIGTQLQSFVQDQDQPEMTALLAEKGARTVRLTLCAADDSLIPAQLSFQELPVEDVEAISLVVTDLTEQEEKRELAEALANLRRVQDELQRQNKAVEAARAAAEAANKAKDNFLAALSHELRTPLTPVLMTVAALEEDTQTPPHMRADLQLIRRNIQLEARLIDDLLDLTRIVHGKVDLKAERTDVHAMINAAIEITHSDIESKHLELIRRLEAKNHFIEGDPIRIQQVLWNLIRNAAKFTPPGGRITVQSDHDATGNLRVTISDTGIGIEPESLDRIFTPFEQVDRTVTRQFGGLGLGLSISKRLSEMHGGTLIAQSEGVSKGATFILTLPTAGAARDQRGRENNVASPQASAAGGGNGAKRLRILLVEDHDDTRQSMAMLLSLHHDVHDTDCMNSALEAAAAKPFDLLISDLGLPDGSGLDLMRRLREQYGLSGICLSGYGMEEDVARSADAGFRKHLTKPVDLEKLQTAIEDLIL
jgi:PAS domain S-box-containing protein